MRAVLDSQAQRQSEWDSTEEAPACKPPLSLPSQLWPLSPGQHFCAPTVMAPVANFIAH